MDSPSPSCKPTAAPLRLAQTVHIGVDAALYSVCFDRANNLVLPLPTEHEVRVCDKSGRLVRKVGAAGEHSGPAACVVDSGGRVFVAESSGFCVKVFRADGSFERAIGLQEIDCPFGVALSRDERTLYVCANLGDAVKLYRSDTGAFVRDITVSEPSNVAVLSTGELAVPSNQPEGGVHIISATDGALVRSMSCGRGSHIYQVAVGGNDNLYVCNERAHQVDVFSSADFRQIDSIGERGQLVYPRGIAIDSTGAVAVTDGIRGRVQLFNAPGTGARK